MYIDIHNHKDISLYFTFEILELREKIHFFGIHPWFIDDSNFKDQMLKIENFIKDHPWALLGETGLDRLKTNIPIDIQEKFFLEHIKLAIKYQRPIVIHCLKAHSDMLKILKIFGKNLTLLIHDFSGGENELKKYLSYQVYFSFGKSLLKNQSKAQMVFLKVPKEKVFFETDDQIEFSIKDIYKKANALRSDVDWNLVCRENFLNFYSFFGDFHNMSSSDIINYFNSMKI